MSWEKMYRHAKRIYIVVSLLMLLKVTAQGAIVQTVTVGDLNNPADTRYYNPGYGVVSYSYSIAKYEVTASQYSEFLNAVAKADTYGLYNPNMATGSHIVRSGSPGSYSYAVTNGYEAYPVNYVSYYNACRFVNWLTNGQPTGPQDATTEDGSYALNGRTSSTGSWLQRKTGTRWVLPSADEWYKAAFYKGGVNGGYWQYPTKSDVAPSFELPPGGTNSANSEGVIGATTAVDAYPSSLSPYGTLGQAGNVNEYTEWSGTTDPREYDMIGYRGGNYVTFSSLSSMKASGYLYGVAGGSSSPPSAVDGFRVAFVPEPATSTFGLILVALVLMKRWPRPIPA